MTDMQGVMLQQVAPAVTADALAGDRTKEPAAREIRIVYEDKSASAPKELLLKSLLASVHAAQAVAYAVFCPTAFSFGASAGALIGGYQIGAVGASRRTPLEEIAREFGKSSTGAKILYAATSALVCVGAAQTNIGPDLLAGGLGALTVNELLVRGARLFQTSDKA
jgi:hypothetical protein